MIHVSASRQHLAAQNNESVPCFFDQEGKFPPSIWCDSSRSNKKVPDRYVPHGWWTDVLLVGQYCDFDHLRKFVIDKHLDSALHKHLTNFNQWDFWNVVNKVLFMAKFPAVTLYSHLGMLAISFHFLTWYTDTVFPCIQNVFRTAKKCFSYPETVKNKLKIAQKKIAQFTLFIA